MLDFRNRPDDSPIVYCISCHSWHPTGEGIRVMKTGFKVQPEGIFPLGLCQSGANHTELQPRSYVEERVTGGQAMSAL